MTWYTAPGYWNRNGLAMTLPTRHACSGQATVVLMRGLTPERLLIYTHLDFHATSNTSFKPFLQRKIVTTSLQNLLALFVFYSRRLQAFVLDFYDPGYKMPKRRTSLTQNIISIISEHQCIPPIFSWIICANIAIFIQEAHNPIRCLQLLVQTSKTTHNEAWDHYRKNKNGESFHLSISFWHGFLPSLSHFSFSGVTDLIRSIKL